MARKRRFDRATDKINICEHFDIILADSFTENTKKVKKLTRPCQDLVLV